MTLSRVRAHPVFVLLAVAVAALWPTWSQLAGTWQAMTDYSHGYLVAPLIAIWIIVRAGDLPPSADRVSPLACIVLLAAISVWLIAYKASSAIGQQLVMPVILWSAVWMGCGLPVARRLATPLACLYFTIPLWELLVPWLQSLTVFVAETTLGWFGIPVTIDDVLVTIPEGSFKVAEGCAGKRYFMVSLALSAFFAGWTGMRSQRAVTFLSITALLALLANWARVVIVIYAGHVSNMTNYLVAREHITFGWAVFVLLLVIVGLIGQRFATEAPPSRSLVAAEADRPRSPVELMARPPVIATTLLLCIPLLALGFLSHDRTIASATPLTLPQSAGEWRGPLDPDPQWSPRYLGPSSQRRATYQGTHGDVEVFVAQYQSQREGSKLISYWNTVLGEHWSVLRSSALDRGRTPALPREPRTIWALSPAGERWVISYLYAVDSVVTTSGSVAQLAYGVLSWKGSAPSRVVAVAARCRRTCEDQEESLESFWNSVGVRLLRPE